MSSKKRHHTDEPQQATPSPTKTGEKKVWKPSRIVSEEEIRAVNSKWEDTEHTSLLWSLINQNAVKEFMDLVASEPLYGHLRSADGRGPMFW